MMATKSAKTKVQVAAIELPKNGEQAKEYGSHLAEMALKVDPALHGDVLLAFRAHTLKALFKANDESKLVQSYLDKAFTGLHSEIKL